MDNKRLEELVGIIGWKLGVISMGYDIRKSAFSFNMWKMTFGVTLKQSVFKRKILLTLKTFLKRYSVLKVLKKCFFKTFYSLLRWHLRMKMKLFSKGKLKSRKTKTRARESEHHSRKLQQGKAEKWQAQSLAP